ncbi:unnamed protein product [Cunninghamella echinulata]
MTLDQLPFEIIQLVSSTLQQTSKKDICECCLVSQKWFTLFSTILYNDITIRGPQHFNSWYKSLFLRSTPFTYYRHHLIRSLTIQDGNINKEQLGQLPELCPYVVNLTIDGRADWDYYDTNSNDYIQQQQQSWWYNLKQACILSTNITPALMERATSQLTHLMLRCKYDTQYGQIFLNALQYTSALQSLTIDEYQWSIMDINKIHDACTHLKILHLTRATLLKTPYHYKKDPFTTIQQHYVNQPALSMCELKLQEINLEENDDENNNNIDDKNDQASNWVLFIVCKYPYLEQLDWWHQSVRGQQQSYPSIHPTISNQLIIQCSQLNSVYFFNINVEDEFFVSLLTRKKGSLKNLGINRSIGYLNSAIPSSSSPSPLQFSPLLTSFSLWWNQHENQNYISFLPWQLNKLHLSGRICDGFYNLHLILDHCHQLEHLHIDFGEIHEDENQDNDSFIRSSAYYHQHHQHRHSLKKLVMEEIKLSSHIMTTISCRCQDLLELDIIDCIWIENNNNNPNNNENHHDDNEHHIPLNQQDRMNVIHIQLYHQKLQRLHLSGIRFVNNPLLRSKSIGIYEFKQPQQMLWYYLSHHATFLTYKPTLGCRYKHPVEVTQWHSIVKKYNASSSYQQNQSICFGPPVELNALREIQRQYGRYSRFQPCSGYVILICQSVNEIYLENKIMLK